MKDRYNPHREPDAAEWLGMHETERLEAVKLYHRRKRIQIQGFDSHAGVHVTVENQLAEGKPANVRATLERLMDQGLSRHEAIHAIGSLVAEAMYRVVREGTPFDPEQYQRDLDALTRDSWEKKYKG